MQVTSDTLFHFTTSLNNLRNILSEKFLLSYCHEKYILNYQSHDNYYPMISFCDIPLSLAKSQIDNYGSYSIGMTKDWAIRNKLNPVVYIETNSLLAKDIQDNLDDTITLMDVTTKMTLENIEILSILSETKYYNKYQNSDVELRKKIDAINEKKFKDNSEKNDYINILKQELNSIIQHNEKLTKNVTTLTELAESYEKQKNIFNTIAQSKLNFFRYIKNYQGTLVRRGKIIKNYRFYDEREWRYVPSMSDKRFEARLNEEQYKKFRGANKIKPLLDIITLEFTSADIKYLIVKSAKDIPKLIDIIKGIDNLCKNSNDTDILTTKILTVEQLNNDF